MKYSQCKILYIGVIDELIKISTTSFCSKEEPFCSFAQKHTDHTVVSRKKGTFISEIILERYIYLRNTQKQLNIRNYVREKSFLRVFSSLKWCSFETSTIIIIAIGRFCITTFGVSSTFYSVFVYISYTVKMPFIYLLHSEVGSSSLFTLSQYIHIL